eukprot:623306-Ditylum_brightwellii.AAC.1
MAVTISVAVRRSTWRRVLSSTYRLCGEPSTVTYVRSRPLPSATLRTISAPFKHPLFYVTWSSNCLDDTSRNSRDFIL